MKPKSLFVWSLTATLAAAMAASVQAGDQNFNIFKDAGTKQTAADFKPAPHTIETGFGTLEFEGGAFPTEASVQKIYDEMDLQRATQAYMDFFPALSIYGIVKSQVRDFGFASSSDVGVMADFMKPSENYLTGNDVTVYAFASGPRDNKAVNTSGMGGNITVGSTRDPEMNSDGSVDLYFGSTLPEGASEKNWIKTDPEKGFFVVFRFYGPLEGYIDKT